MATAPVRLTLYTRANCPLCDEAKETLARVQQEVPGRLDVDIVDIDGDHRLTEAYGTLIPVVTYEDETLFIGKVSVHRLKELLKGEKEGLAPLKPRYKAYLDQLKGQLRAKGRDGRRPREENK